MAKAKESFQLPDDLAAAALIDAKTCAGIGSMGTSWWFAAVRDGRVPAPAFRAVRATRWRRSEALDFWQNLGRPTSCAPKPDPTAIVTLRASAIKETGTALSIPAKPLDPLATHLTHLKLIEPSKYAAADLAGIRNVSDHMRRTEPR